MAGARAWAWWSASSVGGTCVNTSCIPTEIWLEAARTHLAGFELAQVGALTSGSELNLSGMVRRKDGSGRQAVRGSQVRAEDGRCRERDRARELLWTAHDRSRGADELTADAFVVATGAPWQPPVIPGVRASTVVTPDAVQNLTTAPASAVVLGGGPGAASFAVEYAYLLALVGDGDDIGRPRRVGGRRFGQAVEQGRGRGS